MAVQSVSGTGSIRRYTEGYRVAAAIIVFAKLIQILGILLSGGGAIFEILNLPADNRSSMGGTDVMTVKVIIAVGALFAAFSFWVIGVIIAALGQQLRASLDCAVHSSPFLTDEQKALAQGIR